jgi:hypothetical protein
LDPGLLVCLPEEGQLALIEISFGSQCYIVLVGIELCSQPDSAFLCVGVALLQRCLEGGYLFPNLHEFQLRYLNSKGTSLEMFFQVIRQDILANVLCKILSLATPFSILITQ